MKMCSSLVHQEFKKQLNFALIKEWGHVDIHALFLKMNTMKIVPLFLRFKNVTAFTYQINF